MTLFFTQALIYFLATLNMRYVAKGKLARVLVSDVFLCTCTFYLVRQISTGGSVLDCVCGAVLGSFLAMRLDRD